MVGLASIAFFLRRLRAERGAAVVIFGLVLITAFAFAAAPRLLNRVTDEGLRHEMATAATVEASLQFSRQGRIAPAAGDALAEVAAEGAGPEAELPASVRALVVDRSLVISTLRHFVLDPPRTTTFLTLRAQSGVDERIRFTAGGPPTDEIGTDETDLPGNVTSGERLPGRVVQIALPEQAARTIGVSLGDRLRMIADEQSASGPQTPSWLGVEVVGLYEVIDPDDPYWFGETAPQRADFVSDPAQNRIYATGIFAPDAYPALFDERLTFTYTWRHLVDPQRVDAGQLGQLVGDLRRLQLSYPAVGSMTVGEQVTLRTGLSRVLERFLGQRQTTEGLLALAAVGPAAVAGGAIGLVALLVVRRRRQALLLARGRGASAPQLLAAQLVEGLLLAVPAAVLGYLAATVVVEARATAWSVVAAAAAGGGALLLLLGATLPVTRSRPEPAQREEVAAARFSPRRLVFEAMIVGLAVVGASVLRERGIAARGTGGELGIDPFLAAVPILIGLAVGLATLRLFPLPVRLLGWLAALRRDLVPVLALRGVARQATAGHLPLLVLVLTVAIGAFSSVMLVTIDRGQVDTSWQHVGADYRVEPGTSTLLPSLADGDPPGVEAVAASATVESAFSTRGVPQAPVRLYAIEAGAYDRVTAGTPAAANLPAALLQEPSDQVRGSQGAPIPALVSRTVPAGTPQLAVGDVFEMRIAGRLAFFSVAQLRDEFRALATSGSFVVTSMELLEAALPDRPLIVDTLFVRAAPDAEPALRAAVAEQTPSAMVASRQDHYAGLRGAPLVAAISGGFGLAVAAAVAYAALALATALILGTAARTRELAQLRTLGLSTRQAVAVTVTEIAPSLLVALLAGTALGLGVAWLVEPALGLSAFIGDDVVRLRVDWGLLGLIGGALVATVGIGIGLGAMLARRTTLAQSVRQGQE
jgi:putative ABC transport system permease protein